MTVTVKLLFLFVLEVVHLEGTDAACLKHQACYSDTVLEGANFHVYHSSREERSAVSCAVICLQHQPQTRQVMAKLVDVNQRLACGCSSQLVPRNFSGAVSDYYGCYLCPDADNQKCGSEKTSSVYEVDLTGDYCPRIYFTVPDQLPLTTSPTVAAPTTHHHPSLTPANVSLQLHTNATDNDTSTTEDDFPRVRRYPGEPELVFLGCYPEEDINETQVLTTMLQLPGVNITHCAATCAHVKPNADIFLVKLLNADRIYCGCGVESALEEAVRIGSDGSRTGSGVAQCDLYCNESDLGSNATTQTSEDQQDPTSPRQQCGGWTSVSVYTRSGSAVGVCATTSTLILGLVLILLV